jgi:hypothetical protein
VLVCFPCLQSRQQAFLKDSGTVTPASSSAAEIKELAASLVWLRHAVANNIPPDTWPSLLAPTLLTDVSGLYPIPPAKAGADPAETNLHHLARVVALFMPDVPPVGIAPPLHPTAPATHGAPPSPSGGINTQLPPGAPGAPPCYLAPATVRRNRTDPGPDSGPGPGRMESSFRGRNPSASPPDQEARQRIRTHVTQLGLALR